MARSIMATHSTPIPACDVDRYQSWLERQGYRHVSAFTNRQNGQVSLLFTDSTELARYRAGTLESQYISRILS